MESQYHIQTELGHGTYGTVYQAARRSDSELFAIKELPKRRIKNLQGVLTEESHSLSHHDSCFVVLPASFVVTLTCVFDLTPTPHQVKIMQMLDHPNVLQLVDFFENHINLHLVIELCTGGEVFQQIEKQGSLTEGDAAAVMRQTLAALSHCHQHGVCHRDLKPQNLLIKTPAAHISSAQLKIVDFGASAVYSPGHSMREVIGTVSYMAPEVLTLTLTLTLTHP